jgi:hypothetical protein
MAPPSEFLLRVFGCLNPADFTLNNNQIDAGAGSGPGGNDTDIQFNDGGAFGGDDTLTFDKTTQNFGFANTLPGAIVSFNLVGATSNVFLTAGATGQIQIDLNDLMPGGIEIAAQENAPGAGGILIVSANAGAGALGIEINDGDAVSGAGINIHSQHNGVKFNGATIGFFGSTGTAKPTITGSKAANAALTSLLTALAALGILTDSTT